MTDHSLEVAEYSFYEHIVRIVVKPDGAIMFRGKDVTDALGYANSTVALNRHCKGTRHYHPIRTTSGVQDARFITEDELYSLVTKSQMPDAKKFGNWIFCTVLPSIHKSNGDNEMPEPVQEQQEETTTGKTSLPKNISVRDGLILVDGKPLPWPVTNVSVEYATDDLPKLFIAIPAERIETQVFPYSSHRGQVKHGE